MICPDLKAMFGDVFKVTHDPVCAPPANPEEGRGSRSDPWLYTIPCRHGTIYPHGPDMLAFECTARRRIPGELDALGLTRRGWDTWLFPITRFAEVAGVVHPRKRRRLSPAQKAKLLEAGKASRFGCGVQSSREPQEAAGEDETACGASEVEEAI
jgi:hypothetical protein